jgi:tRNA threonylcarbamoyladenosine biosynthesis protein TsaB
MNKLFMDTSAGRLSLSGMKDEKVLFSESIACPSSMAEEIIPLIKSLSEKNGLSFSSYDEIYATTGPGSYTGERISLTIAKTYAFLKKDVKIFLASTLAVMANASDRKTLALIDARNRAFFCGLYENGKELVEDQRREQGEIEDIIKSNPDLVLACSEESKSLVEEEFKGAMIVTAKMSDLLLKSEKQFVLSENPLAIKPKYLRGLNG